MLPIKDMQFNESTASNGDRIVRGNLSFNSEWRISRFEIDSANFDVVEYTKEKMKYELWKKAYGEITHPLRELEFFALKGATCDLKEVREVIEKLGALINFEANI